jgi:hypothetical protein
VDISGNGMPPGFNEEDLYDQFPRGAEYGVGPDEGFNTWVRINDEGLFTEDALRNPAIRAFVDAPFSVNYAQFKSSYRETEYFLHKPHKAMSGQVEGIEGSVAAFPPEPRISTLVMNHERSLAWRITRSLTVEDGSAAGQLIHKEV